MGAANWLQGGHHTVKQNKDCQCVFVTFFRKTKTSVTTGEIFCDASAGNCRKWLSVLSFSVQLLQNDAGHILSDFKK